MIQCAGCRVRHLKCDTGHTCTECQKGGRQYVRLNVRFRNLVCPQGTVSRSDHTKYEFYFDADQVWAEIGGKLEFIAENNDSADSTTTDEVDNSSRSTINVNTEPPQTRAGKSSQRFGSVPRLLDLHDSHFEDDPPDYVPATEGNPHSPVWNLLQQGDLSNSVRTLTNTPQSGEDDTKASCFGKVSLSPGPIWPLENLEEGKLFQHFISHLAPWFDVGDSRRHFGKIAAYMATSNPLLMTALLAMASLHRSRISGQTDLYHAMTLHAKCLSMIVPMLDDPNSVNDDCVLMTTTILHLFDGFESGHDLPRHLKGTSIFLPTETIGDSCHLRKAVFWLHLRQEIYNACLYQRSVTTDLNKPVFESEYEDESGDDDMWFHQTLYITAQVLKWAYGDETSHARWHELCKMMNRWEDKRPASFDPIYFRAQDLQAGRFFPEVCYTTDEHTEAAHFFYLGKLLLTTHDPNIPRIGPRLKSAASAMQATALSFVRTLVGIAVCNNFIPARFTATLAVMLCASWFTDRTEQEALMEVIRETSRCSGWEKQIVQRTLVDEWGWDYQHD